MWTLYDWLPMQKVQGWTSISLSRPHTSTTALCNITRLKCHAKETGSSACYISDGSLPSLLPLLVLLRKFASHLRRLADMSSQRYSSLGVPGASTSETEEHESDYG